MDALRKVFSAIGIVLAIVVGVGAIAAGYLYLFPDNSLFGIRFVQQKKETYAFLKGDDIVDGGLNNAFKNIYIVANGYNVNFVFTANAENEGNIVLYEDIFGYSGNNIAKAQLSARTTFLDAGGMTWNKWTLREPHGLIDKKDSKLTVYLHNGVEYNLMVDAATGCNVSVMKDGTAAANVASLTVTNNSGKVSVPATIDSIKGLTVDSKNLSVDVQKNITGNCTILSGGIGSAKLRGVSGLLSVGTALKKINNPEVSATTVGSLYANTNGGKITIDAIAGAVGSTRLDVNTTNANVYVKTVTGDVKFVTSGDGKITIDELTGDVLDGSKVVYNNATFKKVNGNVNISSANSGKIEVHFVDSVAAGKGKVTASFKNGDVIVRNMQGACNIAAVEYGRGSIDIVFKDLPTAYLATPMIIKAYDGNVKINTAAVENGNFAVKIASATSVSIRKGTITGSAIGPTTTTNGAFVNIADVGSFPHACYMDIVTRKALTIVVHNGLA